jgi:hypothetical protein
MPDEHAYDTRFSLPAVDASPTTETGVILMGLDAERLLAGLGLADEVYDSGPGGGDHLGDPALVALTVDHLRHGGGHPMTFDAAIAAGALRWVAARPALAATDPGPAPNAASPRQAWEHTLDTVSGGAAREAGPATRAYLAACWLRRDGIDRRADRCPI